MDDLKLAAQLGASAAADEVAEEALEPTQQARLLRRRFFGLPSHRSERQDVGLSSETQENPSRETRENKRRAESGSSMTAGSQSCDQAIAHRPRDPSTRDVAACASYPAAIAALADRGEPKPSGGSAIAPHRRSYLDASAGGAMAVGGDRLAWRRSRTASRSQPSIIILRPAIVRLSVKGARLVPDAPARRG